ncbi:MAG: hypothetical protein Kow0027_14670 [Saprospiraceae bacterium]
MKGFRSKIEVILIAGLAIFFLIWAVSKCNSTKAELQAKKAAEAAQDSLAMVEKQKQEQPAKEAAKPEPANTQPQKDLLADPNEEYARLFVVIDKLKLREGPGLKSKVLTELPLFEPVYFLNEMTDSTFEVNLGRMVVDESYMKVRTKKGLEGWVYGAGISYIKKKHPGTLE